MGNNNKHLKRSLIPQFDPNKKVVPKFINQDATKMYGWKAEGNDANVFISFRFIQHKVECLSDWTKDEMKLFWNFIERIHEHTWQMVLSQSGKGEQKAGLGYTPMSRDIYPGDFTKEFDPLVEFFELRISQKARVHCFRNESICYVCWLDRNHNFSN